MNELRVKIERGGVIRVNASKVYGTETEILDKLRSLSRSVSGTDSALTVEGHRHDHVGEHEHNHHHNHEG